VGGWGARRPRPHARAATAPAAGLYLVAVRYPAVFGLPAPPAGRWRPIGYDR
jgi:tRNA pseudouridine38-40 synthase